MASYVSRGTQYIDLYETNHFLTPPKKYKLVTELSYLLHLTVTILL